jgi:hypothetical protein
MSFCPHCGSELEAEITEQEKEDRALVEIERIRADKEIALARLARKMHDDELETTEHVAEVQADAEVESAVAEAEIIGAGLEAGVEPAPEPEPTVVVQADDSESEPQLPERDESHREPRQKRNTNFFGF